MCRLGIAIAVFSEDIWREIQRHKELRTHIHVAQMLGYKALHASRPIIVFECCSEGDLLKWLRRQREQSKKCLQNSSHQYDYAMYLMQQISIAWQVSDGMVRRSPPVHLRQGRVVDVCKFSWHRTQRPGRKEHSPSGRACRQGRYWRQTRNNALQFFPDWRLWVGSQRLG